MDKFTILSLCPVLFPGEKICWRIDFDLMIELAKYYQEEVGEKFFLKKNVSHVFGGNYWHGDSWGNRNCRA